MMNKMKTLYNFFLLVKVSRNVLYMKKYKHLYARSSLGNGRQSSFALASVYSKAKWVYVNTTPAFILWFQ